MSLKIGITSGIGSGKSTVSRIFETLGVPVYYADDVAKELMHNNEDLKKRLIQAFGEETYLDGKLNRKFLSAAVFNNDEKLQLLNSIVHPIVIAEGEKWMQAQTAPYAIKEAALFFESGSATDLDYMIGVYAPETLRIHRVMKRDNITREAVLARMEKQINETVKMRLCDFVVVNDEQQMVIPQVLELHQRFLALG